MEMPRIVCYLGSIQIAVSSALRSAACAVCNMYVWVLKSLLRLENKTEQIGVNSFLYFELIVFVGYFS